MMYCEECKYLPDCELAKHEEVDTCKKGESTNNNYDDENIEIDTALIEEFSQAFSSCNECKDKDNSV